MRKRSWMPLYIDEYLSDTAHLSAAESGAYMLLIMHYWQRRGLPDDDRQLATITKMTAAEWANTRPLLEPFFEPGWRHILTDDELAKVDQYRSPISADLRALIFARDGEVCSYCGGKTGPFHLDHVIPYSRKGPTEESNLVVACMPCNLSKGAKTPEEWRQ